MGNKLFGTAIILAGGDSKRLGYPKTLLKIGDKTIIEIITGQINNYFAEVIVVTDQPDHVNHLPVKTTADIITTGKKSSLRGLHAGLAKSGNAGNFVIACDMPFVNIDLVEYMHAFINDHDAVVPGIDGYIQPLYAFYRKECMYPIEKKLNEGKFKVAGLYKDLKIHYVGKEEISRIDPGEKAFFNINTYADYEEALLLYEREIKQKVL